MILLDTQIVAWLAMEPGKLSFDASEAIRHARTEDGVVISDQTLWELAMMASRRKLELRTPLREFLLFVEAYATVLPIDAAIAELSVRFSRNFPNDPADKIIAATAIAYGLRLITADGPILASGEVACIW